MGSFFILIFILIPSWLVFILLFQPSFLGIPSGKSPRREEGERGPCPHFGVEIGVFGVGMALLALTVTRVGFVPVLQDGRVQLLPSPSHAFSLWKNRDLGGKNRDEAGLGSGGRSNATVPRGTDTKSLGIREKRCKSQFSSPPDFPGIPWNSSPWPCLSLSSWACPPRNPHRPNRPGNRPAPGSAGKEQRGYRGNKNGKKKGKTGGETAGSIPEKARKGFCGWTGNFGCFILPQKITEGLDLVGKRGKEKELRRKKI